MEPLLSVIVPVYKVEAWLDRCVASVAGQTYDNLEIILVDDGSPDGCPALCDGWAEKDCRVRVIHKENGGLSSARNAGLDVCRGEFVAFVDSDDWIEPDYYSQVLSRMLRQQGDIGCAGRYNVDEATMEKRVGLCPRTEGVISPEEMLRRMLTWRECDFSACDKVFRASLWSDIRFPLGKTSEDVGTLYKVVDRAERILLYPEPVYNYFHRAMSITAENFATGNTHIVDFAGEICAFAAAERPGILPEANYFKLKTILYWMRSYCFLSAPTAAERTCYRQWQAWLWRYSRFILFSCGYVSRKEKIWYLLIIMRLKGVIRWMVKRSIRK